MMRKMLFDRSGQDIPEYAIIMALVVVVAAAYLSGLGQGIANKVQEVTDWITGSG